MSEVLRWLARRGARQRALRNAISRCEVCLMVDDYEGATLALADAERAGAKVKVVAYFRRQIAGEKVVYSSR